MRVSKVGGGGLAGTPLSAFWTEPANDATRWRFSSHMKHRQRGGYNRGMGQRPSGRLGWRKPPQRKIAANFARILHVLFKSKMLTHQHTCHQ